MADEKKEEEKLTHFAIWCIASQGEASSASELIYKYEPWEHTRSQEAKMETGTSQESPRQRDSLVDQSITKQRH